MEAQIAAGRAFFDLSRGRSEQGSNTIVQSTRKFQRRQITMVPEVTFHLVAGNVNAVTTLANKGATRELGSGSIRLCETGSDWWDADLSGALIRAAIRGRRRGCTARGIRGRCNL